MIGEPTRRFLAHLDDQDWSDTDLKARHATYKRYVSTSRIALPEDDSLFAGHLLRRLLGVVRISWDYAEQTQDTMVVARRPVPSGGARYPIEGYVADGDRLYHYDPVHHELELVRVEDHPAAPAGDPVVVLTAVFWRSGARYGDFAYRLQCQETGALAAQAYAIAAEAGYSCVLHQRVDGSAMERRLGLDAEAEGVMAVLSLSRVSGPERSGDFAPGIGETAKRPTAQAGPQPSVARSLPYLLALHHAPRAGTGVLPPRPDSPVEEVISLPEPKPVQLYEEIAARVSAPAGFAPAPIGADQLAELLSAATQGYASDVPDTTAGPATCDLYVIVLRVDGIPQGSYRYHRGLVPVGPWNAGVRPVGGRLPASLLALGEAAAAILPVGDPLGGIEYFGDPWYRIQQIEAGLMVHRTTLAAMALGLQARIHSDFCTPRTDAALGLSDPSLRSLSALFVGAAPRRTPIRWVARPNWKHPE